MEGILLEKTTIRKAILNDLNNLLPEEHENHSCMIHRKVLMEETVKTAQVIGITLSAFPEVDTWKLIEKFWQQGKRVAVPKCHPATREMTYFEITSFNQLEVVYMKLKEPIPALTTKLDTPQIDVHIVPGVVFDPKGYRIGFGGGYYDRYLSTYTGSTIAMAFDRQIVEQVPIEQFDLPVQCILTETKRIVCMKTE